MKLFAAIKAVVHYLFHNPHEYTDAEGKYFNSDYNQHW